MSIRKKIIVILIPTILILIALVNYIFSIFFDNYLLEQEDAQAAAACDNLKSYMRGKALDYQGTANDWAHWDDTYEFVNGDNPEYIELNLMAETFSDLDISFIFYMRSDGSLLLERCYDFSSEEFTDFSGQFITDFQQIDFSTADAGDLSSVYQIDGSFYFVAASGITDSLQANAPNGTLVIGRVIDGQIIDEMQNLAGGTLLFMNTGTGATDSYITEDRENLIVECQTAAGAPGGSTLVMSFNRSRDFYLSGQKEFGNFILMSVILSVILVLVLFTLLGIYFTKPITRLIKEVKSIGPGNYGAKLQVSGGGEVAYLGNTINGMLEEIDREQKKVRESEEKLYATLLSVGDGVVVIGRDGNVQFLNPVAQKLTGWTQEEALGRPFDGIFRLINEFTRVKVESPVSKVFETESIVELANHTVLIAKDGVERPIEDTAAPVRDKQGCVVACVLVFRDFSEKKEKQKRIEYLSYHDQLTGLYNRRYFEEEMKRLDTEEKLPLSLIYADVNHLKVINDAFGHNSGDTLIQHAADVLADVGKNGVIARMGGDEFVLLLTQTDAQTVAKVRGDIEERLKTSQIMGVPMSLSFGCDTKTSTIQDIRDTLKNAEDAMYRNKIRSSAGTNTVLIQSIMKALNTKCPLEDAHSNNVGRLCEQTAAALGLKKEEIRENAVAGAMHDIGKIGIDTSILEKSGSMTEAEWAQIKKHPEIGYRILCTSSEYYNIAEYVLAHHERWDGKGYPKGLAGCSISLSARIIAVADAYDAMTSERPYRRAFSKAEAAEELLKNAGKQFDPDIVKVFVGQVLQHDIK